jgi:hypothetical protein
MVNKNYTSDSLSLTFKKPSSLDVRPRLKNHALPPKHYLDFIECGIKLLPNTKALRRRRFEQGPTVRFKII